MAHPLFPWPGGKRRLAKHLLPLFEKAVHTCYVEPFAGGGAMLFARPEPAKAEVLNDVNRDIVTLYRVLANHLDEFMRQFRWALTSREMFRWLQLEHVDTLTDIQRAARFFYLQHLCFGARIRGRTFGTSTTTPARLNLLRLEETLSEAHLRLARVVIECLPWQDCIALYDRPHTLFYCDPPYWKTEGYGVEFPFEQYEQLAACLAGMKGKAILTVNDHPKMREVFAGFTLQTVAITYTIGGTGRAGGAKELIISNR